MTKPLRRGSAVAGVALALCGWTVMQDAPLVAAASIEDATVVSAPSRGMERVSFSPDGTLRMGVAEPAVAEQPAVRIDPPVAEPAGPLEAAEIAETSDDEVVSIDQVWLDLADCESGQRWDYDGSSGYDGGLQFSPSTWRAVNGTDFAEYAWQATPFEQVTVAERLLEVQGWGAWPACTRKLGLR